MKQTINFIDAANNKVKAEITLKEEEKGLVFSMSGDYCGSSGQCFDEVKPANEYQRKLIKLWKKYHLNNLHAGTKNQEEALKGFEGDYTAYCERLKELNLYEVTLKNGIKYKYGSGWLFNELPSSFENDLKNLIHNIEEIEQKNKENPLSDDEKEELKELLEDDKIKALKQNLNLSDSEVLSISTKDEKRYCVNGFDYWVLTEEEAKEEATNYLTDDTYNYQSWVEKLIKDKCTEDIKSIDDWAEWVIDSDGYGHILNGWDGSEDTEKVGEEEYYIMRC
ncbi:MAG: hypothetical protein AABY15_04855 [Nanoarchaeota archaeon]